MRQKPDCFISDATFKYRALGRPRHIKTRLIQNKNILNMNVKFLKYACIFLELRLLNSIENESQSQQAPSKILCKSSEKVIPALAAISAYVEVGVNPG